MKKSLILLFVLALAPVTSPSARASSADCGELDPCSVAPSGLIVRDNGQGQSTVFQSNAPQAVTSDAQAATVTDSFATSANQIVNIVPKSELDQVSSTESWYYWYGPGYNYYGYNYYGYSYYYQPCYRWYYGGYNYYYYYRY